MHLKCFSYNASFLHSLLEYSIKASERLQSLCGKYDIQAVITHWSWPFFPFVAGSSVSTP